MTKMNHIIKKTLFLVGLVALLGMQSCSDFLERTPKDAFTNEDFWSSEASVKTYAWKFYDQFQGYGNGTGVTAEFYFQSTSGSGCANISDDLSNRTFLNFIGTSPTTNTEWNSYYKTIREANLMLERIPSVSMPDIRAKHWIGVARFFRAFAYFQLVQRFGDVVYYDKYLNYDSKDIYKAQTSRNEVMGKVIEDLQFATTNMLDYESANAVNKYAAQALLSRVALYEGTYRKYRGEDGNQFLTIAKDAANAVMSIGLYDLAPDYKSVYNSIDLSAYKEMILYKKYLPSVLGHSIQSYTNTSTAINGLTKAAVENYACSNGLPIVNGVDQNALYLGDKSLSEVISNRDKRLLAVINTTGYGYTDKTLGGLVSSTGYIVALYNNPLLKGSEVTTGGQNHIDAPVFGYAEILLNYAEACAELGSCTQGDLDISINKTRKRAGLPDLVISGTDVMVNGVIINDPKRISALEQISGIVSPLIWEVRRERRAELMTWTFIRYFDLMRWKKGEYLDFTKNPDVALGARVFPKPTGATLKNSYDANGYIITYKTSSRIFDAKKHYLNAIPLNDILLFSAEGVDLTQNPGWNK